MYIEFEIGKGVHFNILVLNSFFSLGLKKLISYIIYKKGNYQRMTDEDKCTKKPHYMLEALYIEIK